MNWNNGQPVEIPQDVTPPDTSSLWGNMFGLGSFFKVVTDPQLQAHAHAMINAIIESAQASKRIEAKLDALLGAAHVQAHAPPPALPPDHGPVGTGSDPPPSGAPDHARGKPDAGHMAAPFFDPEA
jgi:hypothetical protein